MRCAGRCGTDLLVQDRDACTGYCAAAWACHLPARQSQELCAAAPCRMPRCTTGCWAARGRRSSTASCEGPALRSSLHFGPWVSDCPHHAVGQSCLCSLHEIECTIEEAGMWRRQQSNKAFISEVCVMTGRYARLPRQLVSHQVAKGRLREAASVNVIDTSSGWWMLATGQALPCWHATPPRLPPRPF